MVLRPQRCRRDVWSPGQAILFLRDGFGFDHLPVIEHGLLENPHLFSHSNFHGGFSIATVYRRAYIAIPQKIEDRKIRIENSDRVMLFCIFFGVTIVLVRKNHTYVYLILSLCVCACLFWGWLILSAIIRDLGLIENGWTLSPRDGWTFGLRTKRSRTPVIFPELVYRNI